MKSDNDWASENLPQWQEGGELVYIPEKFFLSLFMANYKIGIKYNINKLKEILKNLA